MVTVDEDPELADVRGWYIDGRRVHNPFAGNAALVAPFDRWLAAHDADVRKAALAEAAQIAEREAAKWDRTRNWWIPLDIAPAIRAAALGDAPTGGE